MTAPAAPPPAVRKAEDVECWAVVGKSGRITAGRLWPTEETARAWQLVFGGRLAKVCITEIPGADDGR